MNTRHTIIHVIKLLILATFTEIDFTKVRATIAGSFLLHASAFQKVSNM